MSAIWGCVDLGGGNLPEGLCAAMEKPLHEYKIDRYASISGGNVVMGCGVQYIKTWSEKEPLPIYDAEAGAYFTADCLIDNRAELIAELCPGNSGIPDGELLFLAYKKWGEEMPKRVYGNYSFAAYERKANRLLIVADHTASRSVYYFREGDRVFFGTIEESLLRGKGGKPELNDEWIALYLAMKPISLLTNPEETIFKGVLRVTASCVNIFTQGDGMDVREYWSVGQVKPLKLKSDGEYKEHFRELFFRCAREAVQGVNGETGVMLSSGFDSSAVAAATAPVLDAQGKRLLAYTHVPVEGHESGYNKKFFITDEREGVLRLCGMYPSIAPHFLPFPECDGFSNIREILNAHETPYKAVVNVDWIHAINKAAAADGCRILLDGQMGNGTISWGNILVYERHLLTRGRPFKALSTLNRYARQKGVGRKRELRFLLSSFMPNAFDREQKEDWLEGSFVNRELAAAFGIKNGDERIRMNVQLARPLIKPYSKFRKDVFNKIAFAHIADSATKLALKSGIILKDITRDIRIFEFCSSVPIECFVNSVPETRRLARIYLADLLPPEILPETAPRGRQSGDWLERIAPKWPALYEDVLRVCESPALSRYVDMPAVREALELYRNLPAKKEEDNFMRFGALYILGLFLEKTENYENLT